MAKRKRKRAYGGRVTVTKAEARCYRVCDRKHHKNIMRGKVAGFSACWKTCSGLGRRRKGKR